MNDSNPVQVRFGPYRIDEVERRLERDRRPVELAPRAFQVLCALAARPGQLVPKETLLDLVWGHRHVNEAALKNLVSQLRQALGDDAREPRIIQTVSRHGYRFIAALEAAGGAAGADAGAPIGRGSALSQLRTALATASQGQRQLVFVAGEAGIGKSTVVEQFVAGADAAQGHGQCIEHYGSAEPYMPVLEALGALCRAEGGARVVQAMRRVAPTWLIQLPWLLEDDDRRDLQREAAGATQDRMLREFGELVDRVTVDRPLLLVLEDLHWSDHATVQLLDYLARRRGPSRSMVLGTFRPTDIVLQDHPLAGLRQELRLHRLCREIDLELLSEVELAQMLAARFDTPAPQAFVRALHAHTSGLPLYVVNVLDDLVDDGRLHRDGAGWQFPTTQLQGVPGSLVGVIERQLARLSADQQRALGAAAVGGIEFLHLPLAVVLDVPPARLQAELEAAAARLPWLLGRGTGRLADGRAAARYAFGHALYRQALYERLSALQRMDWHRQWAAALGGAAAAPEIDQAAALALHFECAGLPEEAAAQLALLAAQALARSAPLEALQSARHARQLAPGRIAPALELDLRVLEAVALSRIQVMTTPEVASAFERALQVGADESPSWARALHGAFWVHFARAEFARARELAADMLALAARSGDPVVRVTGLNAMGLVQLMTGDIGGAREHCEQALVVYAQVDARLPHTRFLQDPGVEACGALALVDWLGGAPARARALAERAVAIAVANRHPLSEVTALYSAAILHSLAGEFDAVHALTERILRVIDEHALPPERSGHTWLHAQARVIQGERDAGLAEMRAAAQSARELGMLTGLVAYHYHHALACRAAGRPAEARAEVDAGLDLVARIGERTMLSPLQRMKAEDLRSAGDVEAAEPMLRRAIDTARRQGAAFFELEAQASAAAARSSLCDPERLRTLLALYDGDPSPVVEAVRRIARSCDAQA